MTNEREALERLAREVMGWESRDEAQHWEAGHQGTYYIHHAGEGLLVCEGAQMGYRGRGLSAYPPQAWSPLTDANADVDVLEQVRREWSGPKDRRYADFCAALFAPGAYRTGDYARAALAVLDHTT